MYRRISSYVLLAVIVTLAGCVGGLGDGAVPSGGSSGGGSGGSGGGSSGGSGGDGATLANRTAVLADAGSYTSTWQMQVTEGDIVVGETAYTTAIDYENERSHFSATQTSDGVTESGWETYHADGQAYSRYGEGDEASYTVTEGVFTGTTPFDASRYVTDGSDLADFQRAGTETFDGVQVTRYTLTERPAWIGAQAFTEGEIRWTEFTFEVLVDTDGLVRAETWTSSGVDGEGVTHTVSFTSTVTGVGSTTVDEPAWAETARQQSRQ